MICRDYGVACICREGQDVEKIISDNEILNENKVFFQACFCILYCVNWCILNFMPIDLMKILILFINHGNQVTEHAV